MICYQTRYEDGVFIGTAQANADPLTPGSYALPGGCVATAPPAFNAGQQARWDAGAWIIEALSHVVMLPAGGAAISWDGANLTIAIVPVPTLTAGQSATFDGATWTVTTPPPPAPVPQSFRSQDLMAQFTTADLTAIQTAISGSANMLLLWYSLLAQQDPMTVGNARVTAGWGALVQVLGQPRMNAIATALGVTALVV